MITYDTECKDAGVAGEPLDSQLARMQNMRERLDLVARASGYSSYDGMVNRLGSGSAGVLDKSQRFRLLKHLAPALHEMDETVGKRTLPAVDATGLAAINDLHRSLARLIRVLLIGYTPDELDELADRMKAERANLLDGAAQIRRAEASHSDGLARLDAAAALTSRAMP